MLKLKQLLKSILERLEKPEPEAKIFRAPEVSKWPEEIFETFLNHSVIKRAESAKVIDCDQCEERCFEEVGLREINGVLMAFIACENRDDIGRIRIDLKRLEQWRTGLDLLAGFLAAGLGIRTQPDPIKNDLYKLGETELQDKNVDVFLASSQAQIFQQSADEFEKYITPHAVIFTPLNEPSDFNASGIDVLSAYQYIDARDKSISLDLSRVQDALAEKEATPEKCVEEECCFIFNNKFWEARYKGDKTGHIKNNKRLHYILHLLDNPGKEFTPLKLASFADTSSSGKYFDHSKASKEQIQHEDLNSVAGLYEEDNRENKKKLKGIAYDVWDKLDLAEGKGDEIEIEATKKEWKDTKKYLDENGLIVQERHDILKFYNKHRLTPGQNKARKRISNGIKNCLSDDIPDMPNLLNHLSDKRLLKVGNSFSYTPPPGVIWRIDWPE